MSDDRSYTVVLLPGDGIGVEVADRARSILELIANKTTIGLSIEEIPCGGRYYLSHGRDWPEGSEEKVRAADVILLGAVGWPNPSGPGDIRMKDGRMAGWSQIVGNRRKLDLYANVRPVRLYEGVKHRVSGTHKLFWEPGQVDLVILRENIEGLYCGMGGTLSPGGIATVATDTRIITRDASERIIRRAFETALARSGAPRDGRRRVTCVCKANSLQGCRLFAQVFEEIGRTFPAVDREVSIVDAFTVSLLQQPEHYDVVVTTNEFGDIITDLASVLQGGKGMALGCNLGDAHGMFEGTHGSAPKHAFRDRANPMAMILATGRALLWLAERKSDPALARAGECVELAVRAVLKRGEPLTYDLVGEEKAAPMSVVAEAILGELGALLS